MSINYYENESHLGSRSNYDRMQFGQYVLGDNTLTRLPLKDESASCSGYTTGQGCATHEGCYWDSKKCVPVPWISLCNNTSTFAHDRCVSLEPGLGVNKIKVGQCYTLDDTIGQWHLSDRLKWGQKCNFDGVSNLPDGYKLTAYDLKGSWPKTTTNCPTKDWTGCYWDGACIWNPKDKPKDKDAAVGDAAHGKCEWQACSTLATGTSKHDKGTPLTSPNCNTLDLVGGPGGNAGAGYIRSCGNNQGWPDSACSFMVECADGWKLDTEDGKCKFPIPSKCGDRCRSASDCNNVSGCPQCSGNNPSERLLGTCVAPQCGDPCRSASDCKNVSGCTQCVNGKCTSRPWCKMKPFDNACSCVDNADCKSDYCEIADGVPPTCQDPAAPPTLWRF